MIYYIFGMYTANIVAKRVQWAKWLYRPRRLPEFNHVLDPTRGLINTES